MTGRIDFGRSYPTRCLSCDVPIRKADAVENPDRTGSDRNVAMAPTPKMRMIMCQKPTHRVKATVTRTCEQAQKIKTRQTERGTTDRGKEANQENMDKAFFSTSDPVWPSDFR